MDSPPDQIQAAYYAETASRYDAMHVAQTDEHYVALHLIDTLSDTLSLNTFLDVGCGTGRGVQFLMKRGRDVRGIEPVPELIREALSKGIPEKCLVNGTGYSLPFQDASIDAVFECGVLHHVPDPDFVVKEMMRVARRVVCLSDANRFGQGSYAARLVKLILYKTRLWKAFRFVITSGKMYTISEGDGLAYSYSVFDSYSQLARWADRVWLIPTIGDKPAESWLNPLVTSPHVLLIAIKE